MSRHDEGEWPMPPRKPAPQEACGMDATERARWEALRREAVVAADALRAIARVHDDLLPDEVRAQLGSAADLLDQFGQPIVVMRPTT